MRSNFYTLNSITFIQRYPNFKKKYLWTIYELIEEYVCHICLSSTTVTKKKNHINPLETFYAICECSEQTWLCFTLVLLAHYLPTHTYTHKLIIHTLRTVALTYCGPLKSELLNVSVNATSVHAPHQRLAVALIKTLTLQTSGCLKAL